LHLSISKIALYQIINGIKKGKKVIQFPMGQVLITRIQDLFPPYAYDMIPPEIQKGYDYPEVEEK